MLNENQRQVVESNNSRMVCLAGPGSGKSHTLIERIVHLVDNGVSPTSIMALTFTHAAANEMLERFTKRVPELQVPPVFATFHSFCYRLLRDQEILNHFGYTEIPKILSEDEEQSLQSIVLNKCGIKVTISKLLNDNSLKLKFQKDLYLKTYRKELIKSNCITYDLLCSEICNLFIKDNPIIQKCKEQYQYIFVDEFQDSSVEQFEFVNSFVDSNIMVVGDPLQNLYSFRGTSSKLIKDLAENPHWTTYRLDYNYRSTKPICDYANDFSASYADDSYRLIIKSDRSGPEVLSVFGFKDDELGYTVGRATMETFIRNHKGTTAILARTNREVDQICGMLSASGFDYYTNDKLNTAQNLSLIKSVFDETYMYSWLPTRLTRDNYMNYLRCAYGFADDRKVLLKILAEDKNAGNITRIIIKFKRYVSELDADTAYHGILHDLGYKINTETIINIDESSLQDRLLGVISNYRRESSIYVGTIHSSKGLEYDNVVVYGVDTKPFKLDNEDNNNLFYVAITRAKTDLLILRQQTGERL